MPFYMVSFLKIFIWRQPQGCKDPTHPHFVCKLTKALYGLRQAQELGFLSFLLISYLLASWQARLTLLCSYGHNGPAITLVLVYVDDIIITGNHSSFITTLIRQLSSKFAMKDLGDLHYFLA